MKKSLCILLSMLLLFSNTGLAFSVHYCDNKIASISIKLPCHNQNFEQNCCAEIEQESTCCNDKIIKIEKKSDYSTLKLSSNKLFYFIKINDWKINFSPSKKIYKKNGKPSFYCNSNAPPLYKLHQQFIFYA